ncbi:MAG: hypothetical protein HDP34_02515 [Clostridia bacterium]|nr:hypothetical protein [Clostridia bacterium]
MEELVQKIDELKEVLNANSVPLWLSIFCMIVPIAISIAVAIFAGVQHYQNKKLQKAISDKDLRVQMHGDILSIYDGNSMVQSTLVRASQGIAMILANPNLTLQWHNELLNVLHVLCQANNRAFLLLPQSESDLREVLRNIFCRFKAFCADINYYINSGAADWVRQQTWNKISTTYNIPLYNYYFLSINNIAADDFIKLCTNKDTERMDNEIREILELFHYEKFDKYFEPYLRMYSEEKKN